MTSHSDELGGATADDIRHAYQLVLGRLPESEQVVGEKVRAKPERLLQELFGSGEFLDEVYGPICAGGEPSGRYDTPLTDDLRNWAVAFCSLSPDEAGRVREARNWPDLLAVLLGNETFARRFGAPLDQSGALALGLAAWSARAESSPYRGAIEVAGPERLKGWAIDVAGNSNPLLLEAYYAGRFAGAFRTAEFRRDLAERFGTDGLHGFNVQVSVPVSLLGRKHVPVELREAGSKNLVASGTATLERQTVVDELYLLREETRLLRRQLDRVEARVRTVIPLVSFSAQSYAGYWRAFYAHSFLGGQTVAEDIKISVIVPTHNSQLSLLERAISSVAGQTYGNWELILVDDNSNNAAQISAFVNEYAAKTGFRAQIRCLKLRNVTGISSATNAGVRAASGEFLAFLDHDDLLTSDALLQMRLALQQRPDAAILYSDEDRVMDELNEERFHSPHFKPDFDPILLSQMNYIGHLVVVRTSLARDIGGFRSQFDGAQDHDFLLRASIACKPEQIVHVPRVLYHWRTNPASLSNTPGREREIQGRIEELVSEHLKRTEQAGSVSAHSDQLTLPRPFAVRISPERQKTHASVIIATRDRLDLLRPCIDSVLASRVHNECSMSLVVIDNGSAETESLDYLSDLSARGEAKVLRDGRSFNWARMNNEAASEAEGDVLVFLNNDTVVISDRWCDELCYWASRDNVGGAGGRLLYADGTIQHAGIVLGGEAIARHEGAGLSASDAGYMGRHSLSRRASAVTGACLATRATVFSKLGGFDAASFPIVYNDVDYCLRLQREGFHVVYTPHALLYHFESRSRGHDSEASTGRHAFAIAELRRRWGREIESDRAYNRHFDREATPFSSLVAPAKTTL